MVKFEYTVYEFSGETCQKTGEKFVPREGARQRKKESDSERQRENWKNDSEHSDLSDSDDSMTDLLPGEYKLHFLGSYAFCQVLPVVVFCLVCDPSLSSIVTCFIYRQISSITPVSYVMSCFFNNCWSDIQSNILQ